MRYLLLAIVLTGCWPDEDVVLFDERFEGDWSPRWVVGAGGVQQVETVHPGEHGLMFTTGTWMSVPVAATIYDEYSDGLWVEYSSTCGGAPLLTMIADAPSTYRLWLELPVAVTDVRPEGGFGRVHLNVPAVQLPADPWGSAPDASIVELRVVSVGVASDACLLDNLRLIQPAVDYAF